MTQMFRTPAATRLSPSSKPSTRCSVSIGPSSQFKRRTARDFQSCGPRRVMRGHLMGALAPGGEAGELNCADGAVLVGRRCNHLAVTARPRWLDPTHYAVIRLQMTAGKVKI